MGESSNGEYKEALKTLSERLLPALIPKEKPIKAPKTPKAKATRPKSTPAQKKRADAKRSAKQKASPKREPKRGKTIVDILADVAIFGVEQLRERLRER